MLPAHCLAAGKKLKNYRFKIRSHNGTFSDITVNRDTFLIPSNHREFISSDGKGPRQRAYEARLKQQVADELRTKEEIAYAEKMAPRFETESTSNFAKDGFETKSLEGPKRLLTFNAEYANEEAVTYYSHSVRCGKSNFPATFMPSGQQLFAKKIILILMIV